MQEYQVRRAKEFDELKEVSKTTAISDDIRAVRAMYSPSVAWTIRR
jgi:hypothetical protein